MNGQFVIDSLQHKATVTTPLWPSVSEFEVPLWPSASEFEVPLWPSVSQFSLRVRLGGTVFCILALPRVTRGMTAKEVNRQPRN